MNGYTTRTTAVPWPSLLMSVMLLLVLAASLSTADSFPATPFNGLQITYTISGAKLNTPSDGGPFEGWVRSYTGTLQGDTLRISGSLTGHPAKGYPAAGNVSVAAGDKRASKAFDLSTTGPAASLSKSFDVSVPIPKGATSGSVTATVRGSYSNGEERFVTVTGSFTAGTEAGTTTTTKPPSTSGGNARLPNKIPEDALWIMEKVEGKGEIWVARGTNPDGTPSPGAFKQASNERSFWLRPGDAIRTGPGTEVVFRYKTGAVMRVKGGTTLTAKVTKREGPGLTEFLGRLWKGGCEFYFPPSRKLERDFGIEASRAVTAIKGTEYLLSETGERTGVQVRKGTVQVKHRVTGQVVLLKEGQSVTAVQKGFEGLPPGGGGTGAGATSQVSLPRAWITSANDGPSLQVLFDNGSSAAVTSGPTSPTRFTLKKRTHVLRLASYHFKGGKGAVPGKLSLMDANRKVWGPWQCFGVSNATSPSVHWFANPDVVLPAGTYSIIDTGAATWSCNAASGGAGIAQVCGHTEP